MMAIAKRTGTDRIPGNGRGLIDQDRGGRLAQVPWYPDQSRAAKTAETAVGRFRGECQLTSTKPLGNDRTGFCPVVQFPDGSKASVMVAGNMHPKMLEIYGPNSMSPDHIEEGQLWYMTMDGEFSLALDPGSR